MLRQPGFWLAAATVLAIVQGAKSPSSTPAEPLRRTASAVREVELFAYHDLRDTYGFTSESYGHVELEGSIYNRNSQIRFVNEPVDRLLVGTQGGERGKIIDLGDPRTNTASSKYWSMYWQRYRSELAATSSGFDGAEVHVGHNYLAAIEDVSEPGLGVPKGGTLYVKLRVVQHVAGQSVRFIWEAIE